ncbi:MAG: SDR family oxidoreductase [Leifsonia flava]
MSLWDELPAAARNSGTLDELQSVLESVDGTGPTEGTDADGTWSVYTATLNLTRPLALDPRTGIQRAATRMVDAGTGGRIIATTSVHEHQPRYASSAYVAANHGLGGLIKTLALELGEYDITANSVAPGEIATGMTHQEDENPHVTDRPGVPIGRPGDAREVAAVIAFLASPLSSYVTGASWAVDGGMLQMGPQACSHLTSNDWRAEQE